MVYILIAVLIFGVLIGLHEWGHFIAAKACAASGGTSCAVMNGANEAAVGAFLREAVGFNDIPALVETALSEVAQVSNPSLSDILEADRLARESVKKHSKG